VLQQHGEWEGIHRQFADAAPHPHSTPEAAGCFLLCNSLLSLAFVCCFHGIVLKTLAGWM
jgi:hypothetical protein